MPKGKPQRRSVWRPVHGILLLDKPAGISSNQALQKVRRLLSAEKAGHTGSLDPLATGLLPLCFGEATKIAGLLLGSRKAYSAAACFGVTTDTDDADGAVLQTRPADHVDRAAIEAALPALRGSISQRPPAYSALKRDGVPAYRRARAGETVELESRSVQVDRFDLRERDADRAEFEVECGSGTYIRSLIRDLGEMLGCGAHVTALRRLWVEPFVAPTMWTLEALEAMSDSERLRCLLPMAAGLGHLPRIELDSEQCARLRQGQRLPSQTPAGDYIAWCNDLPVGRVTADASGLIHPERVFNIDPSE